MQEGIASKTIVASQQYLTMEYSVNGRQVMHHLTILGSGKNCTKEPGKLCILGGNELESGVDHDWSAIAEQANSYSRSQQQLSSLPLYRRSSSYSLTEKSAPAATSSEESLYFSPQPHPTSLSYSPSLTSFQDLPVDYIDAEQKQYTYFLGGGTGRFPVYDTATHTCKTMGTFRQCQRDGLWVEYFDEAMTMIKSSGSYRDGSKQGEFTFFYDTVGSPVHRRLMYEKGQLEGPCVEYDMTHQLRKVMEFRHGVEVKQVEFHSNGAIRRVINRMEGGWNIAELKEDGQLLFIGHAKRFGKGFHYDGEGTLFFSFLAELRGVFHSDHLMFDGKKLSVGECMKAIQWKDGKVSLLPLPDGTLLPWSCFKLMKEGNVMFTMVNGERRVLREIRVNSEANQSECRVYSLGGYITMKSVQSGSRKEITEYYPLLGEGRDFSINGITVNPCVSGYIETIVPRRVTIMENKCQVKEELFLNTGEARS